MTLTNYLKARYDRGSNGHQIFTGTQILAISNKNFQILGTKSTRDFGNFNAPLSNTFFIKSTNMSK
jgi:hypothetical protein